jgi:two-component system response regulator ArlR
MRLLLAEDERDYSRALCAILEHSRYAVDPVYTGTDACDYAKNGNYDGIILDVMMPGMDGITALKRLRAGGMTTPVLILTAKTQLDDRITGYDAGADDYLEKPFVTSELLARIRALLRRSGGFVPERLAFGDTALDCVSYELRGPGGAVTLTAKEFQVAELLFRNAGMVLSTNRILETIWGFDADAELNVVWTNLFFLRKKLKAVGSGVEIRAKRGLGYCLDEAQKPE